MEPFLPPLYGYAQDHASNFRPKFNADGLLTAIVQDAYTKAVLMVAWMNDEAIRRTLDSGVATFWSRSRSELWVKGESSGHVQRIVEVRVDCDQDALLLLVTPEGPACHTNRDSCFYRSVHDDGTTLSPVEENR